MLPLLELIPVGTSFILGLVYLTMQEDRTVLKIAGAVLFLAAVYLQFYSRWTLAGLLLQIGLAVTLAIQRRLEGLL